MRVGPGCGTCPLQVSRGQLLRCPWCGWKARYVFQVLVGFLVEVSICQGLWSRWNKQVAACAQIGGHSTGCGGLDLSPGKLFAPLPSTFSFYCLCNWQNPRSETLARWLEEGSAHPASQGPRSRRGSLTLPPQVHSGCPSSWES